MVVAVSTTNVNEHQCQGHVDAAATAAARDDREKNKGASPSMPALTQPTTVINNSDKDTSTQPPLPQHNNITGNTSQDDSMQGTADGDKEVSIMVDKSFSPKWNKMRKLNMVTSLLH
jgi:hypothetical protein